MNVETTFKLAIQHHQAGRLADAEALYRQVLAARPDFVSAYNNLGSILTQREAFDEAVELLAKATNLKPDFSGAWYNLAMALDKLGQYERSIAAYRKTIALDPNYSDAVNNLANVLQSARRLEESVIAHRQAVAMRPDFAWAHWNLGLALLAQGDYAHGWPEFEWRLQVNEPGHPRPNFTQPRWDGSPLHGKRILLWTEQGYGDMMQFVRYVSIVLERGGKPILYCPDNLVRLFRRVPGVENVIDRAGPLPEFDVECPLMSLPLAVGTTPATILAKIPYLTGDPEMWRDRLAGCRGLKVGLVWSGRAMPDPRRTVPFAELAPLAKVPGITWISLQRREADQPHPPPPPGMELIDWTNELGDFADTAALIHHLDLVVSIDTAVVHLAGAMGKTVFALLPFAPDWRWMLNESRTPWYPEMRLFRQPEFGDWKTPIRQIAGILADKITST